MPRVKMYGTLPPYPVLLHDMVLDHRETLNYVIDIIYIILIQE